MAQAQGKLFSSEDVARMVRRIANEILERSSSRKLGLVGIRRGGEPIAHRIAEYIKAEEGRTVPVGVVDITLYRDDAAVMLPDPEIGPSEISFEIEGWDIVLVDDVLQSGRTVRAAIDCLQDYGRPKRIWLAVLCDRGGRELPVSPDFVGRTVTISDDAVVEVTVTGTAEDRISVRPLPNPEEKT